MNSQVGWFRKSHGVLDKLIPCFALLGCAAFALSIQLFLYQPMNFSLVVFRLSLPNPVGGGVSKQLWGVELPVEVKPQQPS